VDEPMTHTYKLVFTKMKNLKKLKIKKEKENILVRENKTKAMRKINNIAHKRTHAHIYENTYFINFDLLQNL
jgi:hypothetical protein